MFTNNGLLDNRGPGILTNKGSLVNNHKLSNDGVFSNNPIGSIVNNSSFINYQNFDNTGSFQNNINGTVTTLGTLANEDELINLGTARIQQLGSIDNTGKFGNQGPLLIEDQYSTLVNEKSGVILNSGENSNIHNDGKIYNYGKIVSTCPINNRGDLWNTGTLSNEDWLENTGKIVNDGLLSITSTGQLFNYNSIVNNGTIEIAANGVLSGGVDNEGAGRVIRHKLSGTGIIIGDYDNDGIISPGASSGGKVLRGNLTHRKGGNKTIELGGVSDECRDRVGSEYDFIDVTGDLILDGGMLNVKLIDGFELEPNQEFIIAKVDGELTGTYEGLREGSMVGMFDSILNHFEMPLYITYTAGDGNDIALYTQDSFPFNIY